MFPAQGRTLQLFHIALLVPAAESDAALSVLQTTALVLETGAWGCVVESAQTLLEHATRTTHAKASFGFWTPTPPLLLFTRVACMVAWVVGVCACVFVSCLRPSVPAGVNRSPSHLRDG